MALVDVGQLSQFGSEETVTTLDEKVGFSAMLKLRTIRFRDVLNVTLLIDSNPLDVTFATSCTRCIPDFSHVVLLSKCGQRVCKQTSSTFSNRLHYL